MTEPRSFLRTYADFDLQQPMDAAVIIPAMLRPQLAQALSSIFAQRFRGRIHILVGIDKPIGEMAIVDTVCAQRPSHCAVQVVWPGFSTAQRHGGLNRPSDGGATRTILTYLANSPYVAYLDDDNWWHPDHLALLRSALEQADWAFSLRWFVHPETRRPVCVDAWESVGPGQGLFRERFGGFVDPSCLMFNKMACPMIPPLWNMPLLEDPATADRRIFFKLANNHRHRGTGRPTSYYTLQPEDGMHPLRLRLMGKAYEEAGTLEQTAQ